MTSLSKGLVWHDIHTFYLLIFVQFHCYTLVGDSSACKRHKTTFYTSWLIFLFKWVVFCNVTSCLHGFVFVDRTLGRVLDLIIGCIHCLSLWIELWPDGLITQCSFNWIGDILYLGWRRWPEFVLQWKAVRCQGEEPGFGLCDHFVFEVGRVTVVLFV